MGDDGRAAATFYYNDPDATGDTDAHNIFVGFFPASCDARACPTDPTKQVRRA